MSGFTGTLRLVRLGLRRDRITLSAWILGIAGFLAATTAMFVDHYAKYPQLLEPDTRIVVENPGMRVLGLVTGPSVGGYALHRDALTLAVLAAVMSILAVVRHTRQSEELGREELLSAGVVGRRASLAAGVIVALAADVVLALVLALALMLAGLPAAGSLAGGTSIALVGVAFTGVAAVTSQLMSTARGATGLAAAGLGLAFLLAALGNMVGTVDTDAFRVTSAWPSWLSPIGWGQQMRPFADDAWWPSGLAIVTVASLFGLAAVLVGRRDVGLGLWPQRRGSARASRGLRSPEGLVWRLQRGALLGWTVGLFGFGLVFGALSEQIKGLQGDAVEWYAAFGGDADLLGAYWASMMQMGGMVVAVYVVMLLLRLHHDEAEGTLEPVLGAAVSRRRWLGAYALNALAGAVLLTLALAVAMAITGGQVIGGTGTLLRDLFGAALAQLPVVVVLGGAVVTVIAAAPRWAVGVSWALVVGSVAAGPMFGPSLGLPGWLQAMSPFTHIPNVPAVAVSVEPIVSLLAAGLALSALGVFLLRRRDLALPA